MKILGDRGISATRFGRGAMDVYVFRRDRPGEHNWKRYEKISEHSLKRVTRLANKLVKEGGSPDLVVTDFSVSWTVYEMKEV